MVDATSTPIHYGRDLLRGGLPAGKRWLVVTTPPVEDLVRRQLRGLAGHVILAPSMEEVELQAWQQALPKAEAPPSTGWRQLHDPNTPLTSQLTLEHLTPKHPMSLLPYPVTFIALLPRPLISEPPHVR